MSITRLWKLVLYLKWVLCQVFLKVKLENLCAFFFIIDKNELLIITYLSLLWISQLMLMSVKLAIVREHKMIISRVGKDNRICLLTVEAAVDIGLNIMIFHVNFLKFFSCAVKYSVCDFLLYKILPVADTKVSIAVLGVYHHVIFPLLKLLWLSFQSKTVIKFNLLADLGYHVDFEQFVFLVL